MPIILHPIVIKNMKQSSSFFISNKNLYSKILPHAESHKAEIKITEKEDKKQKEKILITNKGTKEHRERITRSESQALDQSKREPLKEANN